MTDNSIQAFQPSSGALSAEHYQTFELAKENDSVIGGDDIAQLLVYTASARAKAQAIHAAMAATRNLDDATTLRADAVETERTFARVSIYGDQRIGEILRGMEQAKRGPKVNSDASEKTKADAIAEAGISKSQAYDLQALAANPDVVQAVLDRAEAEGRIPSRKQVLDAIRERDDARETVSMVKKMGDALKQQRDSAQAELARAQDEIAALEKQNDQLYEQAQAAQEPQVVTREVESEAARKRISELEHLEQLHSSDNQKLRKKNEELRRELDHAKGILGMDETMQDVRRDVQYLISATNQYVRQYGGLTWTAASLEQVDEPTREELKKAATNLATFATALVASLESIQ